MATRAIATPPGQKTKRIIMSGDELTAFRAEQARLQQATDAMEAQREAAKQAKRDSLKTALGVTDAQLDDLISLSRG